MSIKPWICNGSKTIIKDRWIDLHADDCALPDGHEDLSILCK